MSYRNWHSPAARSLAPAPYAANWIAARRTTYNPYTPRRVPHHNAYATPMDRGRHRYGSSPERTARGARRGYPSDADEDEGGYTSETDDTATLTGNTGDTDDNTTLAGDSTDTRDEAAASLAVDSDYMEVDEDLPVYRSHYVLPPLDLPDLSEVPYHAHHARHHGHHIARRDGPHHSAPARYNAPIKVKKRARPVRSLFERLGVPLAERIGPAPHNHRPYHRVRKQGPRRGYPRHPLSKPVKSPHAAKPPQPHTVRADPIGRMGRSEFLALLARVGPIASHSWDGGHVVARFKNDGDAQDAVQTCKCDFVALLTSQSTMLSLSAVGRPEKLLLTYRNLD
ncbi:uncharacterized protein LOC62_05G007134 [Vanrija pseudolonga]|uniref:RRM domain-containing protein n=1 Tax=Vanrija pseudolonga TaxID=143232 RepID=A0AAF0YEU3_9TREE|nr:hypothetical protein LOC62_05G007134 [Vanrija pseudolonga]